MPFRFLIASPVLAALAAAAAPTLPIQSYDSYGTWLVACDNTLSCVAKGLDDGGDGAELVIARAAGAAGEPTAVLRAQSSFTLTSVVADGTPLKLSAADWSLDSADGVTALTSKRPAAVRTLVALLRNAKQLRLGSAELPLTGMVAALLRVDDRQGRVGGTTALIRSGPTPASRVPPTPPLPHVPDRPITVVLGRGEGARLIARVRASQAATFTAEDCSDDAKSAEAQAYALDRGRALVLIPCLQGAYQGSSLGYLVPRGGGAAQRLRLATPYRGASADAAIEDMFTEADFDSKTGALFMSAKGRGIADCGMTASWTWDGRTFQLSELSLQNSCGGVEPGDWPALFRTK